MYTLRHAKPNAMKEREQRRRGGAEGVKVECRSDTSEGLEKKEGVSLRRRVRGKAEGEPRTERIAKCQKFG